MSEGKNIHVVKEFLKSRNYRLKYGRTPDFLNLVHALYDYKQQYGILLIDVGFSNMSPDFKNAHLDEVLNLWIKHFEVV